MGFMRSVRPTLALVNRTPFANIRTRSALFSEARWGAISWVLVGGALTSGGVQAGGA
jgi:hypothetical protein